MKALYIDLDQNDNIALHHLLVNIMFQEQYKIYINTESENIPQNIMKWWKILYPNKPSITVKSIATHFIGLEKYLFAHVIGIVDSIDKIDKVAKFFFSLSQNLLNDNNIRRLRKSPNFLIIKIPRRNIHQIKIFKCLYNNFLPLEYLIKNLAVRTEQYNIPLYIFK